jgi:hypothetical protein
LPSLSRFASRLLREDTSESSQSQATSRGDEEADDKRDRDLVLKEKEKAKKEAAKIRGTRDENASTADVVEVGIARVIHQFHFSTNVPPIFFQFIRA